MYKQMFLINNQPEVTAFSDDRSGTFVNNMKLPIHRWFRYSAGFSAEWVENLINTYSPTCILDPFAGSGTTLLAALKCNVDSFGFESHPFVAKIATAKISLHINVSDVISFYNNLSEFASNNMQDIENESDLLKRCYDNKSLSELCALRYSFFKLKDFYKKESVNLIWLAITAILRSCSHVGTAQWQYVLPNKSKSKVDKPFEALRQKVNEFISDIYLMKSYLKNAKPSLIEHDSRNFYEPLNKSVDLVITSPPYPNNYDYADATRLEMCFWREIKKYGDLQNSVRKYIVRSCTQHACADKIDVISALKNLESSPIYDELLEICSKLDVVRHQHGGKKSYHLMIAGYFSDMAKVFQMLRLYCKAGADLCFVVGDSAPYSVYVPVDYLLGQLALANGFKEFYFEKLRDRNIKWKNRKHNVPLKEGRLWIKG